MARSRKCLYVGTSRYVAALDPQTGGEIWRTKLPHSGGAVVTILIHDRHLYIGHAGHAYCLDKKSGDILWENGLPRMGFNPVLLARYGVRMKEKKTGSYAKFGLEDLEMLAEGYRTEVAKQGAQVARRARTRDRGHFGDQVREFERVQRVATGARNKALDLVQLRGELKKIEDELARRATAGAALKVHLERMFRI